MLQPQIDTTSIVTVLASFCVIFMIVIGGLWTVLNKQTKEHKEDLKLFDVENKTLSRETLDFLNKLFLGNEQNKLSDKDIKEKLIRIINLLENLKDKGNV